MRQSNLSALLVSFLTHAGLLGWIVAHPGPSQLNGAMPRSRAPLTVTLLAQEGDNRPTANAAAVAGQSPPAPLTEAQPTQPEPANPPEIAQSEAQPATEENAERSSINLPLTYYPARALSRMPQAISKFEPQPPASGDNGIGGKLALRLWIDASGNLDQIIVIKNDLPPAFEEAALAAFRQMRFSPGEINGVAVGAQVEVVIEYADLLQQPGQGRPGSREAPPASSGERTSQEKTNSAAPIVRP